jgi:phage-related protein
MSSIGPGVREIRVRTELEYRILYVARFEESVYVLHAFEKKSQKTSRHDLQAARMRLHELLQRRRAT